jgi:hypothetical protein
MLKKINMNCLVDRCKKRKTKKSIMYVYAKNAFSADSKRNESSFIPQIKPK